MPRRGLLGAVLVALLACNACRLTVNDYLREAESGDPSAITEAIAAVSDQLAAKERAGVPFDEGDRAAVEYLRKLAVESTLRMHRAEALQGLGRLTTVEAFELYIGALEDPFWLARLYAVRALATHAQPRFVAPLTQRLEVETRLEVRLEIVQTLGSIGGDEAIAALFRTYLRRSQSQRNDERIHAHRALRRLTGLAYGFASRAEWETAFEERFPTSASTPGDASTGASPSATERGTDGGTESE